MSVSEAKTLVTKLDSVEKLFLGICIVIVIAVAVMALWMNHMKHQIAHQTAVIQEERTESIFRSCHEQNLRHVTAIRELNKLLAATKLPKARQNASKKFSVPLISALAPHKNCEKLVQRSVPSK